MTKNKMTAATTALGCVLLAASGCAPPGDEEYPDDPVEIIVPFAAGGATDAVTRALAEGLEDSLDTSVLVVNRPGGGAAIGATEVANSDPDGHTVFLATGSSFTTTPLLQDVDYSPDNFRGVVGVADQPYLLIVAEDSDWQELEDVEGADHVTFAVTGNGNNTHLATGSFLNDLGVEHEAVPFDDATTAIQAVNGDQVDMAAVDLNIAAPQAEDGRVRALAVTSEERIEDLPDVPTFTESGFEGSSGILSRMALAVPAETEDDRVETLRAATEEVIASSDFQEFAEANYLLDAEFSGGDEWMEDFVPQDRERAEALFEEMDLAD